LPGSFSGQIDLKAQSKNGEFAFWFKTPKKDWQLVKDGIDAKYLSTENATGFIGTILGLYVSSDE